MQNLEAVAHRMQHWAADHEALLDARLAGLKADLKLTPNQDKLWAPFEAAVRDAAKMRMEQGKAMDRMQKMRDKREYLQDTKDMGPGRPSVVGNSHALTRKDREPGPLVPTQGRGRGVADRLGN